MISILVASAIPLLREGLLRTLTAERGVLISVLAAESDSVVRSCRPGSPEVLILDMALPGDGIAALLRRVRQKGCEAAVVLFGDWTPDNARAAERLECNVLLSWFDDTESFVQAVHSAAAGERFVTSRVRDMLASNTSSEESAKHKIAGLLTPTERQILRSLATGVTSKQIARDMFISYRTVQKHRNNIARKLNIEGPNALMTYAMRLYTGKR